MSERLIVAAICRRIHAAGVCVCVFKRIDSSRGWQPAPLGWLLCIQRLALSNIKSTYHLYMPVRLAEGSSMELIY